MIGNSGTHAFSQALYKKPMYNSATDFQPVGLVTESPRILIARKDLPVNNLQEFVAYVKANHAKMQFGSAGVGSGTHLPCVLLNMAMGVDVTHVPYRGEGPVLQDVIGGRLDYMELRPLAQELLAPDRLRQRGLVDPAATQALLAAHLEGTARVGLPLYGLMVLELWLEQVVDRAPAAAAA